MRVAPRRASLARLAGVLAGLLVIGCGSNSNSRTDAGLTTRSRTVRPVAVPAGAAHIAPREVALYAANGYSAWQYGPGEDQGRRLDLMPAGYAGSPDAGRLTSFFTLSDVHITDKESPAQLAYFGWAAPYGSGAAGISLTESHLVQRRVRDSGIAFVGELVRRHTPATLRLKELMATKLGPPKLIFCHFRGSEPDREHRCPEGTEPDPCRHELVELIDWCRFAVGLEPTWVTSTAHSMYPLSSSHLLRPDFQTITLDFSRSQQPGTGPMAQISCSRYIPSCWSEALGYRPRAAMQVACELGIAFVDPPSTLVWFDQAGRHQESLDNDRPVGERLLTRFFRAVTSLVVNTTDLDDICRAIEIFEKATRSHEEGRRIEL